MFCSMCINHLLGCRKIFIGMHSSTYLLLGSISHHRQPACGSCQARTNAVHHAGEQKEEDCVVNRDVNLKPSASHGAHAQHRLQQTRQTAWSHHKERKKEYACEEAPSASDADSTMGRDLKQWLENIYNIKTTGRTVQGISGGCGCAPYKLHIHSMTRNFAGMHGLALSSKYT
jgi:hypothetical protein